MCAGKKTPRRPLSSHPYRRRRPRQRRQAQHGAEHNVRTHALLWEAGSCARLRKEKQQWRFLYTPAVKLQLCASPPTNTPPPPSTLIHASLCSSAVMDGG